MRILKSCCTAYADDLLLESREDIMISLCTIDVDDFVLILHLNFMILLFVNLS